VVGRQRDEACAQRTENDRPGQRGLAAALGQPARQIDQPALARDHRQPVAGAAHTDERGLRALRQRQHVEAVGGDIVGGRCKSQQPQQRQRHLQQARPGQRQRNASQRGADHELQRDDPAPFGAEQLDQRAPQRLDHPGQVEPAGVERDLGVAEAQVLVHHDRQRHHDDVRDALAKVQRGNPAPGAGRFGRAHATGSGLAGGLPSLAIIGSAQVGAALARPWPGGHGLLTGNNK